MQHSMVSAVRREQEKLQKSVTISPEISYRGDWPPLAPTAAAERLAERCEQAAEKLRAAAEQNESSNHSRGSKSGESQLSPSRKPLTRTSRTNRQDKPKESKDVKPKKQSQGREGSVRHKTSQPGALPRTASPTKESRRATSHNGRSGGGKERPRSGPPSPHTVRHCYRQEIARLLAQHRQMKRTLPPELRGLPARLMEAAHTLGHWPADGVPAEVLANIDDVLRTLRAALSDQLGGSCPGYSATTTSSPEVQHRHIYSSDPVGLSYPGGSFRGHLAVDNRASCPALLQSCPPTSWAPSCTTTITYPATNTFYVPPGEEQQYGLRSSFSARSIGRPTSPPMRGGARSPSLRRTMPASARSGFQTPVRAARVIATLVSTPVAATPRQFCHVVHADGTPATPTAAIPSWAWPHAGGSVTVQAAPTPTSVQIITAPCTPSGSSRCFSREPPKAHDSCKVRMMNLPTPSRSRCLTSPTQKGRVPIVHATAVASSVATAMPTIAVPMGSARMPASTGSIRVSGSTSVLTPMGNLDAQSTAGTPGMPTLMPSHSSPALVFSVATPVKQDLSPIVPTFRHMVMPPSLVAGPSRCSSPPAPPMRA